MLSLQKLTKEELRTIWRFYQLLHTHYGDTSTSTCLLAFLEGQVDVQEESCAVCGELLLFDASNANTSFCATCDMHFDRCAFSLQLITSSVSLESTKGSTYLADEGALYRCPLCSTAVCTPWLAAASNLATVLIFPGNAADRGCALCPYCAIPFERIN
jgi:hypothetical protein